MQIKDKSHRVKRFKCMDCRSIFEHIYLMLRKEPKRCEYCDRKHKHNKVKLKRLLLKGG